MLTGLGAALAAVATILLVAIDHRQPGRARAGSLRGQVVKVSGPVEPPTSVATRLRAIVGTTALATLLGLVLAVLLLFAAIAALVVVNQQLGS